MSYRNRVRMWPVLICAAVAVNPARAGAPAIAAPAEQTPSTERLEELEEARVKATKLWQLREQMVALEERFYALYNELNQDDEFDVHCNVEAPMGTRLKQRVCRIAYHEDALAAEAQGFVGGYYVPPANMVLLNRYPEYQKKALAVINSDARLRRLVREREQLGKRYEAERKRRFKDKWILIE